MKALWLGLAVTGAVLGPTAAQATLFTFDMVYWNGNGSPSEDPNAKVILHFTVDDQLGGAIGNSGVSTGIWSYGHGSYYGLPNETDPTFHDADIDIFNDYWDGGFDFIPVDSSNNPFYDYEIQLYGPSVLTGTEDNYQIIPGVYDEYDFTGTYDGVFRVTIAEASAAVPEPAPWALMLGGFGLIGSALRRRRTIVSFG